jgi:uncharacterized protein DUF5076
MKNKNELVIPGAAEHDPNAFELLRVWVANQGQHVSLRTGVWKDPAAWGIMLADLARHVANSYHDDAALDQFQTLDRIKAGLYAELGSPTDAPVGGIEKV